MDFIKKTLKRILVIAVLLTTALGLLLHFGEEKLIFFPTTLPTTYNFQFEQPFEERFVQVDANTKLHGLLFRADSSRGLIFFLHGNGGCLASWGQIAKTYTDLNYDLFLLDYRGYGKSQGTIQSQQQLYNDIQTAYDVLSPDYQNSNKIILGYSIGTGPAAWLASKNNPDVDLLILQAPYFNLTDMKDHRFPFIPDFMLSYKFETNKYLTEVNCPVVLFHGTNDRVIPYNSSTRLQKLLKPESQLITLQGAGHNGMSYLPDYKRALKEQLNSLPEK